MPAPEKDPAAEPRTLEECYNGAGRLARLVIAIEETWLRYEGIEQRMAESSLVTDEDEEEEAMCAETLDTFFPVANELSRGLAKGLDQLYIEQLRRDQLQTAAEKGGA